MINYLNLKISSEESKIRKTRRIKMSVFSCKFIFLAFYVVFKINFIQ